MENSRIAQPQFQEPLPAALEALELVETSKRLLAGQITKPDEMLKAVARLLDAPGTTAIDALAFAVTAHSLLSYVNTEGLEDTNLVAIAGSFMERAIQTLEFHTGFSAESFIHRSQTIN